MEDGEQKINFLTGAISEAQELIRFTEGKTALVVTLLGAYLIGAFTKVDRIIQYHYLFNCLFWISLILFAITTLLCVIVVARIIYHTTSPLINLKGVKGNTPNLKYFIVPNENKDLFYPFKNRSKYKLKIDYRTYLRSVKGATEEVIVETLTLELMKVSYIRNLKTDRFAHLLRLLLFTTIAFIFFYFMYTYESQQFLPKEISDTINNK